MAHSDGHSIAPNRTNEQLSLIEQQQHQQLLLAQLINSSSQQQQFQAQKLQQLVSSAPAMQQNSAMVSFDNPATPPTASWASRLALTPSQQQQHQQVATLPNTRLLMNQQQQLQQQHQTSGIELLKVFGLKQQHHLPATASTTDILSPTTIQNQLLQWQTLLQHRQAGLPQTKCQQEMPCSSLMTLSRNINKSAPPALSIMNHTNNNVAATLARSDLQLQQQKIMPRATATHLLDAAVGGKQTSSAPQTTCMLPTVSSPQTMNSESERSNNTTPPNRRCYISNILDTDILCGRGGKSNHHAGNKRYRQVISDMKLYYRQTEAKTLKTDLSRAIVDHVASYGGRFIKKDAVTKKYYVLSKAEARKKASQALRETKELKWTE